jgi:Mg2+/Co2+ transporter CorB
LILISAGARIAYAIVRSDTGIGLSIASYILTCLSLIFAVVAAGEWLGLGKPDAFSFAYDLVQNRVVSKDDVENITAGRWSRMP